MPELLPAKVQNSELHSEIDSLSNNYACLRYTDLEEDMKEACFRIGIVFTYRLQEER